MFNEQTLQQLRQCIEEAVGCKLRTPKDFTTLSESIFKKTRQRVSCSTLKRFWGYLTTVSVPRQTTLDILAQFIDYDDYDSFCQAINKKNSLQVSDKEQVALSPPKAPSKSGQSDGDKKSVFSTPMAWGLYIVMLLVVAGAAYFGLSHRQPTDLEQSPYILKRGQTFATYQDYLVLFGIHATDTLWGQRLPHHPNISVWGPKYHHHSWHNDGDLALFMPTITEHWEPDDGSADSTLIAMRNNDHYYTYRDMNELRITFMQGLTPDGDSLMFLGVYRMDLNRSNTHHVTWIRVANEIDLNRLDYLEELRN